MLEDICAARDSPRSLALLPTEKPRDWAHYSSNIRSRLRKLRQYVRPEDPGPNLYELAVSNNKERLTSRQTEVENERLSNNLRLDVSNGMLHKATASPIDAQDYLKVMRSKSIASDRSTSQSDYYITEPKRSKSPIKRVDQKKNPPGPLSDTHDYTESPFMANLQAKKRR